jgi:cytochrome c oxidase assembly protein subunit 16
MPQLPSRPFRGRTSHNTLADRYRRGLRRRPFLLFGLPFLSVIVAGSFLLTPATAVRYERHDLKHQMLSKDEALGLGKDRRKVNVRDEYYKLAAKDLEDWENRRVPRLKGERDGVLD